MRFKLEVRLGSTVLNSENCTWMNGSAWSKAPGASCGACSWVRAQKISKEGAERLEAGKMVLVYQGLGENLKIKRYMSLEQLMSTSCCWVSMLMIEVWAVVCSFMLKIVVVLWSESWCDLLKSLTGWFLGFFVKYRMEMMNMTTETQKPKRRTSLMMT